MEKSRYPGLELDEDMPLQRREWKVQRIAWAVLFVLLAAIILGLFGNGPISRAKEEAPGGSIGLEYERFMRHRSPETLRLTLISSSESARLSLDGNYLSRIEIKRIVPEPEEAIPEADRMTFVFRAAPAAPMRITFHFQPEKVGTLNGWVAQEDGVRLAIGHFVYP